jgi:energy-coupling factor transport system permease protein
MESRGYGRSVHRDARSRRKATALTLFGLGGVVAGVYGLLDGGSAPLLGLPLLVVGSAAAAASLAVGARRERRSRYRPDPWAAPEWVALLSGAIAGGVVVVSAQRGAGGIILQTSPAVWPNLPWLPALGLLVGLLPAWLTPPPPLRAAERAGRPEDRHNGAIHAATTHTGDIPTETIGSAS